MNEIKELEAGLDEFQERFKQLKAEIQKAIVGYDDLLTKRSLQFFVGGMFCLRVFLGWVKPF